MLLTNETLRDLYLQDLSLPDTFHGRTTPKVKHFGQWKAIQPFYAQGTPLNLSNALMQGRKIYCWSDIHLGHKNIMKYAGRPYPTTELMNECLVGNYLNVVQPEDIVIFGGDIGFMSETKINEILNKLPGYKIQIVGNHDIHRDGKLYDLAFNERHLCLVMNIDDHEYNFRLLFTHYPMDNIPNGCVNVHGHIHQNVANAWNINMCVEHTNYAPMDLQLVIQRARRYIEMHS